MSPSTPLRRLPGSSFRGRIPSDGSWIAGALLALGSLLVAPATASPADAGSSPKDQWIAVVAPDLESAARPLAEHRRAEGHRVILLVGGKDLPAPGAGEAASAARDRIAALSRGHEGTSRVLILGAIATRPDSPIAGSTWPPVPGTTARMRGQPSDNGYGQPADDLAPAVAVGRLPARSPEEASAMVRKTIAFDRRTAPGDWKRRVTVLAGSPSYGAFVDSMVERMAFAELERLDPIWSGRVIYQHPASPYGLPSGELKRVTKAYLEEGQALCVYLGHSGWWGFWSRPPWTHVDWSSIRVTEAAGAGLFATFGCFGAQQGVSDRDGYAIAAVRNPHGPLAACGSHGECWAAMATLMARGLLEAPLEDEPPARLGDIWLAMKRHLARGAISGMLYAMLDRVDGDPSTPQAIQRREHQEMFVLLGDPALRWPSVPGDLDLEPLRPTPPGGSLTVRGELPARLAGARLEIWLERRPSAAPPGLPDLPAQLTGVDRDRRRLERHRAANRAVLAERVLEGVRGSFSASVAVPAAARAAGLRLRVRASTAGAEAMVVREVEVAPAPSPSPSPST